MLYFQLPLYFTLGALLYCFFHAWPEVVLPLFAGFIVVALLIRSFRRI